MSGANAASATVCSRARVQGAGPREILQRPVPDVAEAGGGERWANRRQWREAQDALGVDRVGVAAQGLDAGDAEPARPQRHGRRRRRALRGRRRLGAVEGPRPVQVGAPARPQRLGRLACERLDAAEEARGDGRRAAAFFRARQHGVAPGECGDEILRGLTDAPLRRRQAEIDAHLPVEEGVAVRRRRPHGLVEAGEHDAVEVQQPRLQEAEQRHAGMASGPRRGPRRGERFEHVGVVGEAASEAFAGGDRPFVQEVADRLAGLVGRGERAQALRMGGDEPAERAAVGGAQRRQRCAEIGEQRLGGCEIGVAQRADRPVRVGRSGGPARRRHGRRGIIEAAGAAAPAARRDRAPAPRRRRLRRVGRAGGAASPSATRGRRA